MNHDADTRTPPPAAAAHRARRWCALACVCLAVIVIVMDGSIVNVALPTLAVKLPDASNSRLQWVVDAYILSFASLLLTAGCCADRFGRRATLILGLTVFGAVSIGAAASATSTQLIVWRTLMGIGAAMIFPSTLAIITDDFPEPALRRTAIAIWAGTSGLGVAVGPVAGGWLLHNFQWGAVFLVNIPVVIVAAIGVRATVLESKDPLRPGFDPVGGTLAVLAVLSLVWGLIEAPEHGWASFPTISSIILAASLCTAFVLWERRAPSPMLDLSYFSNPPFRAGCIAISAAFFGLFGFVFMVTLYFQFLHGYDALAAGIRTSPFAGFILVGAIASAGIGARIGARTLNTSGLLLMAIGFAWASRDGLATPYGVILAQMAVLGIGLGLVNASATEAIMSSLPPSRTGTGSSVNDTLREVGGTLGVAAMGSAFNALYRSEITSSLAPTPLPEAAKRLLESSIGAAGEVISRVAQLAGDAPAQELRARVQSAFLSGFRVSCLVASGAVILGAVMLNLSMRVSTAKGAAHPR